MRKLLLPIVTVILFSIFLIPAQPTLANNNITPDTACLVPTAQGAWNISAAMHNNGLLYAAVTDGTTNQGKIRIVVLDPNDPSSSVPGALGSCNTVATYTDPTPFTVKGASIAMPSVVKADSAGNIYIGRVTVSGFRLYIIDAAAPATPTGALGIDYVRSILITGASASTNSGGGMDVSDDYLVAAISQDMAKIQRNRYTILSKAALFALPLVSSKCSTDPDDSTYWPTKCKPYESIAGSWREIKNGAFYHAYSKFTSGSDGIAALPDGRFFVAASFEKNAYVTLGGFLDPATDTITNPYTGASEWANMCAHPTKGALGKDCVLPSAYVGLDNNLYVSLRPAFGEKVIRYNTAFSRWESANGSTDVFPTSLDTFFSRDKQLKFGTGIAADGQGQVFTGSIHYNGTKFGPVNIAYYNLVTWLNKSVDGSGNEYGKPALIVTPYAGESGRLSVMYIRDIWSKSTAVWMTYRGNILATGSAASVCNTNLVVNGGLTYVNSTTAPAAIYANTSCRASQYYATATNSETVPGSVNLANLKPFDPASGSIEVSGMTANADNYVHVRLYDADDNEIGDWMTQKVYVDTNTTVGATYTISSPFTKPRYTDVSTMDGSSYTASSYVRSNVGVFTVDAVTDPTGLSSYQINNDATVNYSEALLGQNKLVLLRENAGMMGVDVVLRDGAGNSETRSDFSLTLDAIPPEAGDASVEFAKTASSPFNGEVTLTRGTASDNTGIWGLWLASAYCGADNTGCPADDSGDLRWGAAPLTSNVAEWNLLTGQNTEMATGVYRVYARLLDGAGNPSATVMTDDVSVTLSGHTVFAPIMYAER